MEYKDREDPSEPISSAFLGRGFRYGCQIVQIPAEVQSQMEYIPLKGVRLLGFVPRQQIPRQYFLKDTFIVLPEVDRTSQEALSALVQACDRRGKVAITQCNLRKGSHVFLGMMSPFMGPDQPDGFLMNVLPFADDVREFQFGSFASKESLLPTDEQLQVMEKIVKEEMQMEEDWPKGRLTDAIANPLLQRFHRFLGKRSLDPAEDPLTHLVFPAAPPHLQPEVKQLLGDSVHLFKKQKTCSSDDDL